MKINKRVIILSFLSAILFISSLFFRYNEYTKTSIFIILSSLIIFLYLIYYLFYRNSKIEKDNRLNRILKEYESIIVYVDELSFDIYKAKELNSFKSLLKVSKELKKPILFFKNKKENIFYIDNKKGYLFIFK